MLATDPPFREVWCTHTSQMTVIDSLLYNLSRGSQDITGNGDDEEIWTPRMEAEFRFAGYQSSKGKQKTRRSCEGGFTLGAMADIVADMFSRDEKAEWVVLESVRQEDDSVSRVLLPLRS